MRKTNSSPPNNLDFCPLSRSLNRGRLFFLCKIYIYSSKSIKNCYIVVRIFQPRAVNQPLINKMPTDQNAIKTLDAAIQNLDESIKRDDPLHMRDDRAKPDDGYGNYVTIAEAVVTDRFRGEKIRQRNALVLLKDHLMRCQDDQSE